ncbi:glycosyltransferase family 2 protein [Flavobacterium sp.]|uniref:glycosyltransferase family 2 protein n=1 Tax=Flavobacterium sp. TaxID=239 RepID=UPI002ED7DBA1
MNAPIVSIVMITYGQEKFIDQAIEGVLMQQCEFEVELIIANDCSPDETDSVIKQIIKKKPENFQIKYFNHEKNLGMMPNFIFAMQQCKGKYIAMCEGDDYWIDPHKLKKQVDFLEKNKDYVLCFHPVKILNLKGELENDFITKVPNNYESIATLAEFGNYIHTPSVVFRNIINKFPFEFEQTPIGDYFLYMILAQHGKLKCIDSEMAVYRYGVGVFSKNSELSITKANLKLFTCLLSYFKEEEINKIIFKRHLDTVLYLEKSIHDIYQNKFVSDHVFFKFFKIVKLNYRSPRKIVRRIVKRLKSKN